MTKWKRSGEFPGGHAKIRFIPGRLRDASASVEKNSRRPDSQVQPGPEHLINFHKMLISCLLQTSGNAMGLDTLI
jgi:hypothetical protein